MIIKDNLLPNPILQSLECVILDDNDKRFSHSLHIKDITITSINIIKELKHLSIYTYKAELKEKDYPHSKAPYAPAIIIFEQGTLPQTYDFTNGHFSSLREFEDYQTQIMLEQTDKEFKQRLARKIDIEEILRLLHPDSEKHANIRLLHQIINPIPGSQKLFDKTFEHYYKPNYEKKNSKFPPGHLNELIVAYLFINQGHTIEEFGTKLHSLNGSCEYDITTNCNKLIEVKSSEKYLDQSRIMQQNRIAQSHGKFFIVCIYYPLSDTWHQWFKEKEILFIDDFATIASNNF